MRLRDGGRRMAREWYAKSLVLALLSAAKRADLPRLIGQDRCPGNWTFACQKRRQRSKMNLRAYQRGAAMDETIVGVAMGFSVLLIATLLVVGHYRREHLRQRMIRAMHGHRLYDFTRPKR